MRRTVYFRGARYDVRRCPNGAIQVAAWQGTVVTPESGLALRFWGWVS